MQPGTPQDAPFLPLAEKMLNLLEKYRVDLQSGPDGRGPSWLSFISWVFEQGNEDSKDLVSYLSRGIASTDKQAVWERIKIPSYWQCYKFVLVLQSPSGSKDKRLRDIFRLMIHKDTKINLRGTMLKARFCLSASNRGKGKPTTMKLYNTDTATNFELLFFLVGICYISPRDVHQRELASHSHKKRRTNRGPSQKSKENAQIIGFAVQQIIRAWDTLSDILGFRSVEELISPYIIFLPDSMIFKAIHTRGRFAPLRQSFDLQSIEGPTNVQEDIDPPASRRETSYDRDLRALASFFLEDIYGLIAEEAIYQPDAKELHVKLREFVDCEDIFEWPEPLSKRFTRLSKNLLDRVSIARKRELGKSVANNLPIGTGEAAGNFPKFQQLPEYLIHFAGGVNGFRLPFTAPEIAFSNWELGLRKKVSDVPATSLAACEMSHLGLHVTDFPDYTKSKVFAHKPF